MIKSCFNSTNSHRRCASSTIWYCELCGTVSCAVLWAVQYCELCRTMNCAVLWAVQYCEMCSTLSCVVLWDVQYRELCGTVSVHVYYVWIWTSTDQLSHSLFTMAFPRLSLSTPLKRSCFLVPCRLPIHSYRLGEGGLEMGLPMTFTASRGDAGPLQNESQRRSGWINLYCSCCCCYYYCNGSRTLWPKTWILLVLPYFIIWCTG